MSRVFVSIKSTQNQMLVNPVFKFHLANFSRLNRVPELFCSGPEGA